MLSEPLVSPSFMERRFNHERDEIHERTLDCWNADHRFHETAFDNLFGANQSSKPKSGTSHGLPLRAGEQRSPFVSFVPLVVRMHLHCCSKKVVVHEHGSHVSCNTCRARHVRERHAGTIYHRRVDTRGRLSSRGRGSPTGGWGFITSTRPRPTRSTLTRKCGGTSISRLSPRNRPANTWRVRWPKRRSSRTITSSTGSSF